MMYVRYLWTVLKHKWFVFVECAKEGIAWRGLIHDMSKFLPSECIAYAEYFEGDPDDNVAFNAAWALHVRRNDHHWLHWLVDGEAQEMPFEAVVEMVCDWVGAARAYKGDGIVPWYTQNGPNMVLHAKTRELVEELVSVR